MITALKIKWYLHVESAVHYWRLDLSLIDSGSCDRYPYVASDGMSWWQIAKARHGHVIPVILGMSFWLGSKGHTYCRMFSKHTFRSPATATCSLAKHEDMHTPPFYCLDVRLTLGCKTNYLYTTREKFGQDRYMSVLISWRFLIKCLKLILCSHINCLYALL